MRAVASNPPDVAHVQLLLLRMGAALLVTSVLWCLPPAAATALMTEVNATMRRSPLRLLCAANYLWKTRIRGFIHATLLVRMAGLGLADRSVATSAAHAASWLATPRAAELTVSAQRELALAVSVSPVVAKAGVFVAGADLLTVSGGAGVAPSTTSGGTTTWPWPDVGADTDTPPPLSPPASEVLVSAATSTSLAACSVTETLRVPLLPNAQMCLTAFVAEATLAVVGSLGGSPFQCVPLQITDLLQSLTPPVGTADLPTTCLPHSLGVVADGWAAMLAAPRGFTQRHFAHTAHLTGPRPCGHRCRRRRALADPPAAFTALGCG